MSKFLKWGFLGLLFSYLYLPIAVLVANSFNAHKYGIKWTGFTTKWYDALLNNAGLMQAASHSLTIAVLSASLATIIGTLTAVALFRYRFKGKIALNGMLFVVMTSPDIVMAVSLLALFVSLGMALGFWSLLFAHITFCLPFVVVTVYARLKGFDNAILEAARDLGASEWRIFKKIILPLATPAIFAGWLLSFTLSLDDVIISSFVTGPGYEILPLKIYSMVKVGVSPEVNALAALMLVLSLLMVALAQLILKRKSA
ncbi:MULTISPECIES: spermidine/putrescine ABC transporter permease PotC [Ferrimonas]|uniref:spermidine/putrescine ABC transporter permease PotC n=1 Tax=Ferrimonas TaxID=44011 RepID=UPI000426B9FD|nr:MULTISPECIES: spermidine/putrescine ABC transporter permease PotC [Ferrimonas]USD35735.1 spermidine/putrescine ABC transporter permease PotC [Ferrimonas sp. SCSIO 43195]